ncbi:MAG: alpha-L-glutamate ligase-like protein [Pirellulales bacterium]|nr:alpha-L-glutamate ligase-like protein [Pirellulales bacterium]
MSTAPSRRWFAWPHELEEAGVLGINRRNFAFIQASNPRALYPRVDNKIITKEICLAHSIPVPETYAVIRRYGDVRRFRDLIADRGEFVIKPACGSAGRGIMVIARRKGKDYETSSGRTVSESELDYHLSTILSGLYSLGGQVDSAIIEQRIIMHPIMSRVAVGGTPDVRVILYRSVPVMAMVRLPTVLSEGKANLHQGAVAAAVHLDNGRTFGGVCKNHAVERHPDTGELIGGLEIPGWRDLLGAAMKLSEALELGYIGVDFVIDATRGAVVLEANARPGLAIQVAHRTGLLPRLRLIDSLPREAITADRRWELLPRLAAEV